MEDLIQQSFAHAEWNSCFYITSNKVFPTADQIVIKNLIREWNLFASELANQITWEALFISMVWTTHRCWPTLLTISSAWYQWKNNKTPNEEKDNSLKMTNLTYKRYFCEWSSLYQENIRKPLCNIWRGGNGENFWKQFFLKWNSSITKVLAPLFMLIRKTLCISRCRCLYYRSCG